MFCLGYDGITATTQPTWRPSRAVIICVVGLTGELKANLSFMSTTIKNLQLCGNTTLTMTQYS